MSSFIPVDRQTDYLFPPSVEDWLPEDHLARFIVEVIERLDLGELTRQYAGRGSAAHHPAVLLGLLIYGYATGVPSSRKIERASYDSVAFRYIAANTHPDHDTLANFRRRFGPQLEQLFVQVLMLAREMGMLKLGKISVDGSKIKANASKHSALSWGYLKKIEHQLQQEVQQLMALAESEDRSKAPDGMDVPHEIARRHERLAVLDEAKRKLEARARERDAQAQAEYEAKMAKRQAKRDAGKKPGGKDPEPPGSGPQDKAQINLTDEQSRIMKVSSGFDQCYNAQAAVDTDSMLMVANFVTSAGVDSQQVKPMLARLEEQQGQIGKATHIVADTGFFSAANVDACEQAGLVPLIAMKREGRGSVPTFIHGLFSWNRGQNEGRGSVPTFIHGLFSWNRGQNEGCEPSARHTDTLGRARVRMSALTPSAGGLRSVTLQNGQQGNNSAGLALGEGIMQMGWHCGDTMTVGDMLPCQKSRMPRGTDEVAGRDR
jgi:transposase